MGAFPGTLTLKGLYRSCPGNTSSCTEHLNFTKCNAGKISQIYFVLFLLICYRMPRLSIVCISLQLGNIFNFSCIISVFHNV